MISTCCQLYGSPMGIAAILELFFKMSWNKSIKED